MTECSLDSNDKAKRFLCNSKKKEIENYVVRTCTKCLFMFSSKMQPVMETINFGTGWAYVSRQPAGPNNNNHLNSVPRQIEINSQVFCNHCVINTSIALQVLRENISSFFLFLVSRSFIFVNIICVDEVKNGNNLHERCQIN